MQKILSVMFFLFIFSFNCAYSYIDPGFGSMIVQFLVAGVLGGLYCVKVFWRQIKSFTCSLFRKKGTRDVKKGE